MKHGGLTGRIALNPYFRGSHFHHLNFEEDLDLGVYVPIPMHRKVFHNSDTGKGMDEINNIVYGWVIQNYKIDNIKPIQNPSYNDFIVLYNIINDRFDLKHVNGCGMKSCVINDQKFHIRVSFQNEEAGELIKARNESGLNWSNLILVKSGVLKQSEIKSNKIGNTTKIVDNKLILSISVTYLEGEKLQKAMALSGKSSWRSYILHILGIKCVPLIQVPLTAKQIKELDFEKKKNEANIHDLKCFSCVNGGHWWCKLFYVNVIDMAHNGIKFENCNSYKEKIVSRSRDQTPHIQISGVV